MKPYLLGSGKVYLAARDAAGLALGYAALGNAPEVILNPGRAGERYATGGSYATRLTLPGDQPSLDMILEEFQAANLEKLLFGTATSYTAGTITDEVITARAGLMVPLSKIALTSFTKLTHFSGSPTYTPDTDYSVNLYTGAIYFPVGSAIADGQQVKATYAYAAQQRNPAFITSQPYYALRIDGYNAATYGGFTFDAYKVRLFPPDSIPFIGDGLSSMRIRVRILYDDLRTGSDGRYFNLALAT